MRTCPAIERGHWKWDSWSSQVIHHLAAGNVQGPAWMPYKYSKESSGPAADTLCPLTRSHCECWLVREQEEDLAQTLSSSLMMCNLPSPNTIHHPQPLRAGRHLCRAVCVCFSLLVLYRLPKHRLWDFNPFAHLFPFVLPLLWLLLCLVQNDYI